MTEGTLHFSMNTFDLCVLAILGLSSIIAFFRGFLRELLSFLAWVGAAAFTIYYFPHASDIMHDHIHDPKVAAGAGAMATYFTALICISIINSGIIRYTKEATEVGLLDNFLGLVFGFLRGAFIVSFGFLIMSAVIPRSPQPEWLKGSATKPYLEQGAELLVSVAPKYMADMKGVVKKQVDHEINPQNYNAPDVSKDVGPKFDNAIR